MISEGQSRSQCTLAPTDKVYKRLTNFNNYCSVSVNCTA